MLLAPLSGSVGGAPILLDEPALPGVVVHENQADSGYVDRVQGLYVGNPNPNQVTVLIQVLGAGVPDQTVRIDVPSTAEGMDIRTLMPTIIGPGYSYNVAAQLQSGNRPLYLFGETVRSEIPTPFEPGGSGGLSQIGTITIGDGILDTGWDTYPWTSGAVANPVNVVQDAINNRFQINREGQWLLTLVVNISFVSSNSGRETNMRFYDETQGASTEIFPLYAGRDETGTIGTMNLLFDMGSGNVGHWFRIELGGGDTFTGVEGNAAELALVRVGDA